MSSQASSNIVAGSWTSYVRDIYASRKPPPPIGTVDMASFEAAAREKLKDNEHAFMYVFGSAGTYSTYEANMAEMKAWKVIPRMLRNATTRNVNTTLFGIEHPSPLLFAPIGVQGIMHPEGDAATAAVAAKLQIPFILSTAATRSIETVAKVNGSGHRWYQLYWPKTDDVTLSLLSRAKASGYTALVVTLDTPTIGWRPHDLQAGYLPFLHGIGIQIGLTDPVFMRSFGEEPDSHDEVPKFPYDYAALNAAAAKGDKRVLRLMKLGSGWLGETSNGVMRDWPELKLLRDNWDGPIILKGIQDVEDAQLAIKHGMNGIVVSNHGGRQVDGAIPSLHALYNICSDETIKSAQASGKLTVLFDSGIRTGSDIIKAVALGADAVLLGRPFMYGLCVGGQQGVETVVRSILADLELTLGLTGYKTLDEIRGKGSKIITRLDQSKF